MHLSLQIHDDEGRSIDPAELGMEAMIARLRAGPEGEAAPLLGGCAVDVLTQVQALLGQLNGLQATAICAMGRDDAGGPMTDYLEDEIAAALVLSRRSAQWLRAGAETLRCHSRVWDALVTGRLDGTRARILGEALFDLPRTDPDGVPRAGYDSDYALLLDRGLAYALDHTARQLELFLRRLLARLGVDVVPARRKQAMRRRGVWLAHGVDGTAELTAVLASEDAERVYGAIRALALADRDRAPDACPRGDRQPVAASVDSADTGASVSAGPGDFRDLGPWMADALVDAILAAKGSGSGVGAAVSTEIHVTIPIDSLAGLTDAPAEVNGFGIIPTDVARRLAAGDARWRHILVEAGSGAVLDVGTRSYRPSASIDRHVRLRDGSCRFPGCLVPARECDLDHLVPFPLGSTSVDNLHALCRRHHRLKHESGWEVGAVPGHGLRWTSPSGTVAVTYPEQRYPLVA